MEWGVELDINTKKIVDCATLAGKVMLESNAESYRCEETIQKILETSGWDVTEVLTMLTGFVFTLDDPSSKEPPFTVVKRVSGASNQLGNIYRVNNISRALASGKISPDEAFENLRNVDKGEYPDIIKIIGSTSLVMGFAVLLGARQLEVILTSLIAGLLVATFIYLKSRINITDFLHSLLTTALVTFAVHAIGYYLFDSATDINIVITASFMPLYPGTVLTNGIRDTIRGDYISGTALIVNAIVVATSIALGVVVGIGSFNGVVLWI